MEKVNDKSNTLHVWAGILITFFFGLTSWYIFDIIPFTACLIGLLIGNAAGFGKEFIWDKKLGKGVFNWQDIYATGWGTMVGAVSLRVSIDVILRITT